MTRPNHLLPAAAALLLSGCAYIGEPLAPTLNIPERVTDLSVVERGGRLVGSFSLPVKTTDGTLIRDAGEIEVRVGEAPAGGFNPDAWAAQAQRIEQPVVNEGRVEFAFPAAPWTGKEIVAGVRVYGVRGKRTAGWSNFAAVRVIEPLPETVLQAEASAAGVRLRWKPAAEGARIFRADAVKPEFLKIADAKGGEYIDSTSEFDKPYRYQVQLTAPSGPLVAESELSPPVAITPADTFAPATPTGLNAIAGNASIELVWERNLEADLAGYSIYRAPAGGELTKLSGGSEVPSFSDRSFEPGKRYRYAVAAFDRKGNESARSTAVEITAP